MIEKGQWRRTITFADGETGEEILDTELLLRDLKPALGELPTNERLTILLALENPPRAS